MKLGILSDIHEDIESLKFALNVFAEKQCNELVCLGDILGFDPNYYNKVQKPNASECLNIIKNEFKYVVVGNHDLYAVKKIPEHREGLFPFPEDWYNLDLNERQLLSQGKIFLYENEVLSTPLSEEQFSFVKNLPEFLTIEDNGTRVLFSHSIYPDFTGTNHFRYYNHWEVKPHLNFMNKNKIEIGFSGHTHSMYPQLANNGNINKIPYRTLQLSKSNTQYFCPCIVKGKSKRGITIVDIGNNQIEFIEIKNKFTFKLISFYGTKNKKN